MECVESTNIGNDCRIDLKYSFNVEIIKNIQSG